MSTFAELFKVLRFDIQESPLALQRVPNRIHKRKRGMSASYHRRVQKKWIKRFGTHDEGAAYFISPSAIGLSGRDRIVMHPELAAVIRNLSLP